MKACFLFTGLLISLSSFSQTKVLPEVKSGTKMQYTAMVNGQEIPVMFSIDSLALDYLKIGWSVEGYGAGAWIMNKKSLQSANSGMGENPEPGVEQVLPDDKAQLVLSKDQWAAAIKDKKVRHNNSDFNIVALPAGGEFKLKDKVVDAIYLETADKSTKMWVLNNPALPLLVKVVGNTNGPDLTLLTIE
jgi:hypothetical protein